MRLFFPLTFFNQTFSFSESDCHHILHVLKMNIGSQFVCNYEQKSYQCEIINTSPLQAKIISILNICTELQNVEISLFQAVIKPKHMEWILSKATEMHVNHIYPTIFARTQQSNIIKMQRMQHIIETAAKQSNRLIIPSVNEAVALNKIIDNFKKFDIVIIPFEKEQKYCLSSVLESSLINLKNKPLKIAIVIGPEGGFSDNEINLLNSLTNTVLVGLSKTILRSETASFYTLAILCDYLIKKGF